MVGSWEHDNKHRGGPSSMDVLVQWLLVPGNYDRWQRKTKSTIAGDIAIELLSHGIIHRSPKAVYNQISSLEKRFASASEWLMENEIEQLYLDGETDTRVNDMVRRICPRYKDLACVFHRTSQPDKPRCNGSNVRNSRTRADETDRKNFDAWTEEDNIKNEQLLECEIEHKKAMSKCQLEGEQRREEIRTQCEIVLARQKLLDAGVDENIVNNIFPLEK